MLRTAVLSAAIALTALPVACEHRQPGTTDMTPRAAFKNAKTADLVEAALQHDRPKARTAKAAGADPDARGEGDITPLLFAMLKKDPLALEIIAENGANPNLASPAGDSPVSLAAGADDIRYIQVLLNHRGDPNTRDLTTPITFIARSQGRLPTLRLLLDKGADINATDGSGDTLILKAAYQTEYPLILELLERGADHTKPGSGNITLAWVVQTRKLDPKSPLAAQREKVIDALKARGVKFPVVPPWEREQP